MSSSEGTCPLQEPLCSGEEGLVVGHQTSYHSADPDPEAQISDAQSTPLTPLATSLNGNVPHTDDDEVEANGDGTKKKRVKLKGKSLRDLTTNQRNLLIALCILYFALYMLLSLIGPFFPIEAAKKGQTPFETGVVISMSWIVMFFMAPLVGFLA